MSSRNLKLTTCLVILSILATFGAAIMTFPLAFGLSQQAVINHIEKGSGYLFKAPLPAGLRAPRERAFFFPQSGKIFEDGLLLDDGQSSLKAIERGGWGRIRIQKTSVYFSTSDCAKLEGRTYEIALPAIDVPEFVLGMLWMGALGLWVAAARQSHLLNHCIESSWKPQWFGMLLFTFLVGIMLARPGRVADDFFLGLGFPLLWALALGLLTAGRRWPFSLSLGLLAIIPAAATYIYYAINGSSHDSFLVAGVLPWSDAWMHFLQAAEIAREGITQYAFNGRFLYPAYFSSWLWIAHWNLSLANAFVAAIALGSLAMACWAWRPNIGYGGTALFVLLCWLYFREFGCGLVMTEGLGLTCGLVSLTCFYWGCKQQNVWFFFSGLFWMSMGSSARPGALFALPLLGFSTGWLVWRWSAEKTQNQRGGKIWKTLGAVVFAALIMLVPFALNGMMVKVFYQGKTQAFGNFAFTLHGLLTGTKWNVSYEAAHGDIHVVMADNLRMLKNEPKRLATGVWRAYQQAWKKSFLYRFGEEKRLAASIKWLALLGAVAFGVIPALRIHAPWVWAGTLGIILSIPFAPPWDAGVRPYAASMGLQALLPAAGLAFILQWLASAANVEKLPSLVDLDAARNGKLSILAISAFLLISIIVLPLARHFFSREEVETSEPNPKSLLFRPGSVITIEDNAHSGRGVAYEDYQKRLAAFVIGRGEEEGNPFIKVTRGTQFGINWNDLHFYRIQRGGTPFLIK